MLPPRRRLAVFLLLAFLAAVPGTAAAQSEADRAAVHAAVEDYVEALYQAAPERIARSVHPELVKFGFWRDGEGTYRPTPMNYEQLHGLAARWNVGNQQGITADTPKEIVVLDVLDKTAAAKLTAKWGVDYFHLAKGADGWQIVHVLWQSPPPSPDLGEER